jgi:DNA polymerase-3 subunit delta
MILAKRPDVERFLADPKAKARAVVVYGRDHGAVRELAEGLARKISPVRDDPFNVALLVDGDLSDNPARLEEELQALSLMGGPRLVRLRLTSERAALDKLAAEALTGHAEGRFNPDAFLIVEAGALGRDSALRKAAEKAEQAAAIPVYEDEPGDLMRIVREALTRDQVGLTSDALELFVSRLPKERGVARAEIERLALYLGPGSGKIADPAELEAFLGVEPEASLSDAANEAFGGRGAPAQAGLRRAFAEGETGPAAVRAAGLHLARLRRAGALIADGSDPKIAAKAVGVFWKQEREFLRQVRAWTGAELDKVQPDVLEADKACKTSGSPDALLAERLLLSIAGRAKRLGL